MDIIRTANVLLQGEYGIVLYWLVFIIGLMGVDIITGYSQSIVNEDNASAKMSKGLLKKFSLITVLIVIIPYAYLLPDVIDISLIVSVYLIESLNELTSIIENLTKMGVEIEFIKPFINKLKVKTEVIENDETKNN